MNTRELNDKETPSWFKQVYFVLHILEPKKRTSHAYGPYWPSFQSQFLENMEIVLYNKGYQMLKVFILLQLIQVLTPGKNLLFFYEEQNEVGVRTSISLK